MTRLTTDGARARSDGLEPLIDAWLWQTGPDHRLLSSRSPPVTVGAGESSPPLVLLYERFVADEPAALKAALDAAAPLDDMPVRLARDNEPPCHGLLRGRAVRDATGRFMGYHGTFHQPALPPLARSQAPASTAADAESFSHTISHDLRAPIRVIEGFTKIVKEDYGALLDRVGNDHLDRVLGAAARLNGMIDALQALARLSSQPLARQAVNLSQLAGYIADDLRRQAPGRVVEIEIEPDLQVEGDPTLLRMAVAHLIGNAWKYTGKTAQARIAFGRHAQEADTFTVQDNGAGFDMRFADRLFGTFQRLHSVNDYPGTGVGLATVRRIVRRHGGEVRAEAEVNRGARFHFTLPQGGGAAPT